jgi:hypothetical protein
MQSEVFAQVQMCGPACGMDKALSRSTKVDFVE